MWCNQIFALLKLTDATTNTYVVENCIVADNFEIANKIARASYGDTALAIDTTRIPVHIGDVYMNETFYNINGEAVEPNPTEAETIKKQQREINKLTSQNDTLIEYIGDLLYEICQLKIKVGE